MMQDVMMEMMAFLIRDIKGSGLDLSWNALLVEIFSSNWYFGLVIVENGSIRLDGIIFGTNKCK